MASSVQELVAAVALETQLVPVLTQRWHLFSCTWKTNDRDRGAGGQNAIIHIKQHYDKTTVLMISIDCVGALFVLSNAIQSFFEERNDITHCFTLQYNDQLVLYIWAELPWGKPCPSANWVADGGGGKLGMPVYHTGSCDDVNAGLTDSGVRPSPAGAAGGAHI